MVPQVPKDIGLRVRALGTGPMMAGIGLNEPGESLFLINARNAEREFNVLVDCGTQAVDLLRRQRMQLERIDAVLITHMHPDHVGGLAKFLLGRRFPSPDGHKPILYVPDDLAGCIWPALLCKQCATLGRKKAELSDFCDLRPITAGKPVKLLGGRAFINLVRVLHQSDGGKPEPCYGFELTDHLGIRMFFTGDSIYQLDSLREYYQRANFVLQDLQPGGTLDQETIHALEAQLTRPEEVGGLPEDVKRKSWAYHCVPDPGLVRRLEETGFLGIVAPGHTFHFGHPHTYLEPYSPMAGEYLGQREEDLDL